MKATNASIKRNSFKTFYFENENMDNKYNFPVLDFVKPQKVLNVLPFNVFKSKPNNNSWIHFFIDDYQFERVWQQPTQYIKLLKQANGVITTDFSMFIDMPKALQIYNCYRNRALARFFQRQGINIIPAVGWSDKESFSWCFDGIAYGSAIAVSSNGCYSNPEAKKNFLAGFHKMLEKINPCQVIFIGVVPNELKDLYIIEHFTNFSEKFANFRKKE